MISTFLCTQHLILWEFILCVFIYCSARVLIMPFFCFDYSHGNISCVPYCESIHFYFRWPRIAIYNACGLRYTIAMSVDPAAKESPASERSMKECPSGFPTFVFRKKTVAPFFSFLFVCKIILKRL